MVPNIENSLYGELFEQSPNGKILPGLAQSWGFSDHNRTFTIHLRHGVKFSDGTPFTAAAVVSNFEHALNPKTCVCASSYSEISNVKAVGGNTVVLTLKQAFAPLIDSFLSEPPNWVPSPTALKKDGVATFEQHPVGAGPYMVSSNVQSSQTVLVKNPNYWQKDHPLLGSIKFVTTPNDQSAYGALVSGQAQAVLGITTPALVNKAKSSLHVQLVPGVTNNVVAFNTTKAPFNNMKARLAVIYATDPETIQKVVSPGYGTVSQSPSGPGSPYYEPKVPGYPSYNPAKAKALVKQLGGLSFSLFYGNNSNQALVAGDALRSEFAAVGMKVSLNPIVASDSVQIYQTSNWTGTYTDDGALDPDYGAFGLPIRFSSAGLFSGVKDKALDQMINKSGTLTDMAARKKVVFNAFHYIATHAYADWLFVPPGFVITSKSLKNVAPSVGSGSGLSTLQWENVSLGG